MRFLIFLMFVFVTAPVCAQQPSAKFLPPDNKILLFIGQDRASIDAYSRELNTVPAGVMFYTSLESLNGLTEPIDYGSGYQDAGYLLKQYPDSPIQIGLYLVGSLPDILNGKLDANIKRLGEWIKGAQRPVFLRIGYEFDLPENHYDPEEYKNAFRYIVDHLRAQGVTNVAYIWHSYGVIDPKRPFIKWYPGDEYVDWFGVSFFRVYNREDAAAFGKLAGEHHKPLIIAEACPNSDVTKDSQKRWERWYKALFKLVSETDARAICYINSDWESFSMWRGQGWGDSRVEADPYLKDRWLKEIRDNKYIRPSSTFFKVLGLNTQ